MLPFLINDPDGAFGEVYRGQLRGTECAIKSSKNCSSVAMEMQKVCQEVKKSHFHISFMKTQEADAMRFCNPYICTLLGKPIFSSKFKIE